MFMVFLFYVWAWVLVCLQVSFVLNHQKCDLVLVSARKLDFICLFSHGLCKWFTWFLVTLGGVC